MEFIERTDDGARAAFDRALSGIARRRSGIDERSEDRVDPPPRRDDGVHSGRDVRRTPTCLVPRMGPRRSRFAITAKIWFSENAARRTRSRSRTSGTARIESHALRSRMPRRRSHARDAPWLCAGSGRRCAPPAERERSTSGLYSTGWSRSRCSADRRTSLLAACARYCKLTARRNPVSFFNAVRVGNARVAVSAWLKSRRVRRL